MDADLDETHANPPIKKGRLVFLVAFYAALGTAVSLYFYYLLRGRKFGRREKRPVRRHVPPPAGLSEAEAAARFDPLAAEDNIISGRPAYSRKQVVREGVFTIFNLNLILLAVIQAIFVRPLDGLITLGVIVANVAANIFQYEFTRLRLRDIQKEARPQVTVMRGGQARSIDPKEIVTGDVLAAGQGDQIIADGVLVGEGRLVVDESLLGQGGGVVHKKAGDALLAGSICLNGRAAYRADVLGDRRRVIQYLHMLPDEGQKLTPIEKVINGVMRTLLIVMIALVVIIFLNALRSGLLGDFEVLVDPIIVILNLAPASLFFMVLLTYVSATADLARVGALVHQSRTVESMAQLDVLCLAKAGFLTGIGFEVQAVENEAGSPAVALPRVKQILGDFAHSTTETNPIRRALAAGFPGTNRKVRESAPFMSAYGWSALIFDDDELQGLYVMALPEVFDLAGGAQQEGEEEEQKTEKGITRSLTAVIKRPLARLRGKDKQKETVSEPGDGEVRTTAVAEAQVEAAQGAAQGAAHKVQVQPAEEGQEEPEKRNGRFNLRRLSSRMARKVTSIVKREGQAVPPEEGAEEPPEPENTLIFAYNKDARALSMDAGAWRLPPDLTPLCRITFSEKVKPEAREAINLLSERGVAVKIFTPDEAEQTAVRLREAGVRLLEDPQLRSIDAPDLAGLETAELGEMALTHTVFGSLAPQQAAAIVRALRAAGKSVGVAGDGVNDVAALRSADLAIVRKDSSPAVLGLGDIVLLSEEQGTLSQVMEKGQMIVNGLIDILKLYLTQIFYLLFLIVAIPILERSFPYTSAQSGLIGIITLTIPAFALTLFAGKGKLPRARISRILANFVAPAAVSIAILGLIVYELTLRRTGSASYAQNVLTYASIAMGLLLVLNIKPPLVISLRKAPKVGDLRPLIIVIFSVVALYVIARIPFLSNMFGVVPLQEPADVTLVLRAAIIWLLVVRLFWRLFPAVRRVSGGALQVVGLEKRPLQA